MPETVLIVDDEESVRRTFHDWLTGSDLGLVVCSAADAESALVQANQRPIDLAVLDWNLGAGNDGLRLLEDLYLFHPSLVAIMVTGFAHQATPLDAMRMGVRDYLDKNQDLNRTSFLNAVRKQLDYIRPAKREREVHQSLMAFREAVEKVLPLVQAAAALNDPVPLPHAIGALFRFLMAATGASDGALLVRSYDESRQPAEVYHAYDVAGRRLDGALAPFARSLAGTVVSLQEPCALTQIDEVATGVILQPFERNRRSLLAAPIAVAPGVQAVVELFDKQGAEAFTPEDHRLAGATADFGGELLRQALAERQTHRVLFDAVAAALRASDGVAATLRDRPEAGRLEQPPPAAVLDQLRQGLSETTGATVAADDTLRLAEAIRVLALRHGPAAVQHCTRLVESVRELLDSMTGA